MSYAQRYPVDLVTDAAGAAIGYTPIARGRVVSVIYTKTDFANGVDIAVTGEDSTVNIWTELDVNASKTVAPQQPTHSQAGVAALYAAGGTAVNAPIYVAGERIKIVIAQGGNTKSGRVEVLVE